MKKKKADITWGDLRPDLQRDLERRGLKDSVLRGSVPAWLVKQRTERIERDAASYVKDVVAVLKGDKASTTKKKTGKKKVTAPPPRKATRR